MKFSSKNAEISETSVAIKLTLDTADILGVREALILTPFPMVALFPVLLVEHFS